jgi:hypothetical protein
MLKLAKSITLIALILIAIVFFNLGMDWFNFGTGIHPMLAFPICLLAVAGITILVEFDLYHYPGEQ